VAAIDVIGEYVEGLPAGSRRLAEGEWGVTVGPEQAGGWPLDIGIRLVEGMVQAKALALTSPEGIDPWMLLWWNRQTRYVRFGCTQGREIWVHADMPAAGLDARAVDRLLGLVVEGALAARSFGKDSAGTTNASHRKDSAGKPNASP
jgi:Putative bacterial sensory transduction regulator